MIKFYYLIVLISGSLYSQVASVGINTPNPDPSSILEVSAEPAPHSGVTSKKGLLIPRVSLLSSIDQTTIPTPAKGLMVYNTADKGVFPNNVTANNYYFWDGAKWMAMPLKSFVEEAVKPRVYYIEGTDTQTFNKDDFNYTAGVKYQTVTFPSAEKINVGNIITNNGNGTFKVNVSGLYDFSAFVNYNPMNITYVNNTPSGNKRAFLNLMIQTSKDGEIWDLNDTVTRTAWGVGSAGFLKTANIMSFPIELQKGTFFRLVAYNPFDTSASNDHGHDGNPYIGTGINVPISKGIRIHLLDFNL